MSEWGYVGGDVWLLDVLVGDVWVGDVWLVDVKVGDV